MFVRVKKVGTYRYLQIAENRREGKRVKQTIIATLGRLDKLAASGTIDQLLRSAARFAERLMVLAEHSCDAHDSPHTKVVSVGPALIFERLWRETGCQEVVRKLLATRHHHFDVERAVFMTVLHRLMVSGSDRNALQWRRDQAIGRRSAQVAASVPRDGLARRGAVRSTPRPLQRARPGVLRHHLVVLHRQRWRHPRPVRQEQAPPLTRSGVILTVSAPRCLSQ